MNSDAQEIYTNRYMPSLLSRLTDDEPFQRKDSHLLNSCSIEELKQDVLLHLEMLLNSHISPKNDALLKEQFPQARASAYNYGIVSFTGRHDLKQNQLNIVEAIRESLICFEPRFLSKTIQVNLVSDTNAREGELTIEISCDFQLEPLSKEMLFRIQMNLDSGNMALVE